MMILNLPGKETEAWGGERLGVQPHNRERATVRFVPGPSCWESVGSVPSFF